MIIDKQVFLNMTKAIKDTMILNEKIAKNLEDLVEGYPFLKNTDILNDALINIVESLYGNDLYSYWIYEQDFGKKLKKDSVTKFGKSVNIRTISNLYKYLESMKWNEKGEQ